MFSVQNVNLFNISILFCWTLVIMAMLASFCLRSGNYDNFYNMYVNVALCYLFIVNIIISAKNKCHPVVSIQVVICDSNIA